MAVRGQGLLGDDDQGSAAQRESVVYVLHPNCAVDDF